MGEGNMSKAVFFIHHGNDWPMFFKLEDNKYYRWMFGSRCWDNADISDVLVSLPKRTAQTIGAMSLDDIKSYLNKYCDGKWGYIVDDMLAKDNLSQGKCRIVTAPQEIEVCYENSVFLAGGITGCPDWQSDAITHLTNNIPKSRNVVVFNPRRELMPEHEEAEKQIVWEHNALREAGAIIFWFPCETLCPITLYELGAWSMTDKHLFVGVHPDYGRSFDVEIQTRLTRSDIVIRHDLDDVLEDYTNYLWSYGDA